MKIDDFLALLKGVQPAGEGSWVARCPAHGDAHPSMSVAARDGKILVHCHVGCSAADIVGALGLELKDLFEDAPKPASTSTKIPSPGAVRPDATERVPPIGSPRPDATERVPPIHQASPLPGGTGSVPSAPTKVLQPPPKKQPSARTEVLNVGTKDGEAIPWLIELPEGGEK